MKAVVVYEAGGSDRLIYTDLPRPLVKEGWSLVKVRAFGVNRSEIFTRQGLSPSVQFPRVLGIECVGEIVESNHFQRGQKILSIMGEMGRAFDGSYAEYTLLPDDQIYPIESQLSWADLAAIPETYYTAFGSMNNLRLDAADKVLVRGASSAAGLAFVQLVRAQYPQLEIDGSTQHLEKRHQLLEAGYTNIIEDRDQVLVTDKSYDKVLELVGPATIKNTLSHVNEQGIVCSTGQLGGKWFLEDFDPIMELQKNLYLTTFYSGNVSQEKITQLFDYIATYQVGLTPPKIFSLKEVGLAHDYLESKGGIGKAICLVTSHDDGEIDDRPRNDSKSS